MVKSVGSRQKCKECGNYFIKEEAPQKYCQDCIDSGVHWRRWANTKANREHRRTYSRAYRVRNRDKIRAYQRNYKRRVRSKPKEEEED